MDNVQIATSQNVAINYRLAGITDRIAAYLIDSLIVGAALFLMAFITLVVTHQGSSMWMWAILWLAAFLYPLICEISMNGQTIGKKSMNIRVVKLDGSQATTSAYVLRWLFLLLDVVLTSGGLALLCIAFTQRSQRVGDLVAGTTVIKAAKTLNTLQGHRELNRQVEENYEPQFAAAANLSSADIQLIKRSLKVFEESGQRKPMNLLQKRMEEKLGLSSGELSSIRFLNVLLKDHAYYSAREL